MPIPEGYEIYEHPSNAGVFLRRIPTQVIDDQERAVVERGLRAFSDVDRYIVDVKQNVITVYLPNQGTWGKIAILSSTRPLEYLAINNS